MAGKTLKVGVLLVALGALAWGSLAFAGDGNELDCLASKPVRDVIEDHPQGPIPGPGVNTAVAEKGVAVEPVAGPDQPGTPAAPGTPTKGSGGATTH